MTRFEFDESGAQCQCGGSCHIEPHPSDGEHPGKVVCDECSRMVKWLQKDKNSARRPVTKRGTKEEVWAAWGNCCIHCGLSKDSLEILGVPLTVQHAPPYATVKDEGYLLPYCNWCQQASAGEYTKRRALLRRLADPKTRDALAKLYERLENEPPKTEDL